MTTDVPRDDCPVLLSSERAGCECAEQLLFYADSHAQRANSGVARCSVEGRGNPDLQLRESGHSDAESHPGSSNNAVRPHTDENIR